MMRTFIDKSLSDQLNTLGADDKPDITLERVEGDTHTEETERMDILQQILSSHTAKKPKKP